MNPPPRRSEDDPLSPRDGAGLPDPTPLGSGGPADPTPSGRDPGPSLADTPAARDPLLDDPLFADLVDPKPVPDLPLSRPSASPRGLEIQLEGPVGSSAGGHVPAAGKSPLSPGDGPVTAEVIDPVVEALPVARLAGTQLPSGPVPTLPVTPSRTRGGPWASAEPIDPPRDRKPASSRPVKGGVPAPPAQSFVLGRPGADMPESERSRPRVLVACSVMGCVCVALLVAFGFMVYAAILILNHLGNQATQREATQKGFSGGGRPGPITTTQLVGHHKQIALSGEVDTVGRGAGGRYLFLRIPSQQKLVVFDPNVGEVIHSFSPIDSNTLFSAGASKLFLYKPKSRTVERWDLESKNREHTNTLPPESATVEAIAIGPGSDGPLYMISTRVIRILDPVELSTKAFFPIKVAQGGSWEHARASDDGNVLALTGNQDTLVLRREIGDTFVVDQLNADPRPRLASPSPDGEFIYTPRGVFKADGTPFRKPLEDDYFYTFPAAHGNLYLSLGVTSGNILGLPLRLHVSDSRLPLATLDLAGEGAMPFPTGLRADAVGSLPPDQRIHLWPAAGLLAILPHSNKRIDLVKLDVGATLKASEKKYTIIGSDPPRSAIVGSEWRYTPELWINPPVQLNWVVADGPVGMQMKGQDLIWPLPLTNKSPTKVRLQASKPSGQILAEQKFEITVMDPLR